MKAPCRPTCGKPCSIEFGTNCGAPGHRPAAVELDSRRPDSGASPLEAAIGQQRSNATTRARDVAGRRARTVVARVELGFTHEELAALLGKASANAARMALERALLRLRRRWATPLRRSEAEKKLPLGPI